MLCAFRGENIQVEQAKNSKSGEEEEDDDYGMGRKEIKSLFCY